MPIPSQRGDMRLIIWWFVMGEVSILGGHLSIVWPIPLQERSRLTRCGSSSPCGQNLPHVLDWVEQQQKETRLAANVFLVAIDAASFTWWRLDLKL